MLLINNEEISETKKFININVSDHLTLIKKEIINNNYKVHEEILIDVYLKLLEFELNSIIKKSSERFTNKLESAVSLIKENETYIRNLLK